MLLISRDDDQQCLCESVCSASIALSVTRNAASYSVQAPSILKPTPILQEAAILAFSHARLIHQENREMGPLFASDLPEWSQ